MDIFLPINLLIIKISFYLTIKEKLLKKSIYIYFAVLRGYPNFQVRVNL